MTFNEHPVEVIDWLDHHHDPNPDHRYTRKELVESTTPLLTVRDVGFVVYENDRQITLARSQYDHPQYEGEAYSLSITILKALIVRRKRLGRGKTI